MKSVIYKTCYLWYALLNSARIFPFEAMAKKLWMAKEFAKVSMVGGKGEHASQSFRIHFAYAKSNSVVNDFTLR